MNEPKNFSILIPTRHRIPLLDGLIESIVTNTQELNQTEIIVMYDNDDNSTAQQKQYFLDKYGNKIKLEFYNRERSFNMNGDYYNYMATNLATGKYLIAVNDDTKFIKYAWDTEARIKIEKFLENKPDGVFYGVTDDMEVERKRNEHYWFSCFPLVSKAAVNIMGFFFDPHIWKDGADWDLLAIYKNIDRALDLRNEIIIQHISVRSGRRGRDILDEENTHINASMIPRVQAGYNTQNYVEFLRTYIQRYGSEEYKDTNFLKLAEEGKCKTIKPY